VTAEPKIWIGAEPTFTRRESNDPWWLWQADPDDDGADDKRRRAAVLAVSLARRVQGASVQRLVGRQYPDEDRPRFNFGVRLPEIVQVHVHDDDHAHDHDEDGLDGEVERLLTAEPVPVSGGRWATVTADPGVVEVNTAPCPDLPTFGEHLKDIWIAARSGGLSSYRWRYNGDEVDSGGGGQLTLGGPSAAESPFFVAPWLLPRMVKYFNNHPSLSYWFLGECAGSACQSPRADEGVRERWEELRLACGWLEREALRGRVTPEILWSTLAPLLVDAGGNSHRAELNVEKLWNPHLTGRGKLGVVELRAFRMPAAPEGMVAAAALVRAVAARCARAPYDDAMIDWQAELHDRWALPWFLGEDLDDVLDDLEKHGCDLAEHQSRLRGFRKHGLGKTRVGPFRLELSRAVEFWPLVGDVASQERATARMVDASSERLELVADCEGDRPIAIRIAHNRVAPRVEIDGVWHYHVLGLRRRQFCPSPGLVESLPADEPLEITVECGESGAAVKVAWYAWRPDGGAYDGLPTDAAEAERRRAERLVVTPIDPAADADDAPRQLTTWTLDVRALRALAGDTST
jgi:uncharacterized protein (DUF2126 family)